MNEEFNVSPEDFKKLPPDEAQDNENIAGPSLSFGQSVWLQLKKKKFTSCFYLYFTYN